MLSYTEIRTDKLTENGIEEITANESTTLTYIYDEDGNIISILRDVSGNPYAYNFDEYIGFQYDEPFFTDIIVLIEVGSDCMTSHW